MRILLTLDLIRLCVDCVDRQLAVPLRTNTNPFLLPLANTAQQIFNVLCENFFRINGMESHALFH